MTVLKIAVLLIQIIKSVGKSNNNRNLIFHYSFMQRQYIINHDIMYLKKIENAKENCDLKIVKIIPFLH